MRRSLRPALAAALGTFVLVGAAAGAPAPKRSQPVTILYTGSFTMANVAQPQSATASYDYWVAWTYWWTGTWATLFRDPSVVSSSPARFTKVKIDGKVDSTYKLKADDQANQTCTSRLVRDDANRPTLRAAYDTSANTLQVFVEAPTFRGGRHMSADFNCQNGPGTNVFGPGTTQSPPASFNPLGAGASFA
jgi:hypothetical protein